MSTGNHATPSFYLGEVGVHFPFEQQSDDAVTLVDQHGIALAIIRIAFCRSGHALVYGDSTVFWGSVWPWISGEELPHGRLWFAPIEDEL